MSELRWMKTFILVAERGSFSAAAEPLQSSVSAVSRAVQELEEELGVRLLNRSTRKVALTDAGRRYLELSKRILDDLSLAKAQIRTQAGQLAGLLRLSAPVSFAQYYLQPMLLDFMASHPQLDLDLDLALRPPDLVESGFDIIVFAARAGFDAAIYARFLGSSPVLLLAAPSYLKARTELRHPEQLREHQLIDLNHELAEGGWLLRCGDEVIEGRSLYKGRWHTNSLQFAISLAINGQGIVAAPAYAVSAHLQSKELVQVLNHWTLPSLDYYAAVPSRRLMEPRVQVLLDSLSDFARIASKGAGDVT